MVARSREHEALSPLDASNASGGCEESVEAESRVVTR